MFFFALSTLAATPRAVLELSRQGPLLILNEVYLNHHGPFRMLIDTGSSSSSIARDAARRIGLTPTYAVEHETPSGTTLVGATLLDVVSTGGVSENAVEVMILPNNLRGIDGVLGQSWLAQHDYLLDYRSRRLVLDPDPPMTGVKLALRACEGRPAVAARVEGREIELVLDSGTESLVLFDPGTRSVTTTMFTMNGSITVGRAKASVAFGDEAPRTMRILKVNSPNRSGLLPLAAFSAVYVSHQHSVVVLVR